MMILSRANARLGETRRPNLKQIFGPVSVGLQAVEARLAEVLGGATDGAIREIIGFLLESPGKRIRPALVLLSTRAAADRAGGCPLPGEAPIAMATAIELIHMASLIHDDLIDGAAVRHHRASINARWGPGIAIALGDYLCSQAMATVCECHDSRVFAILGSELSAMCEGELLQVIDRADFTLSERHCLAVIERKTASLFGACCEVGASAAAGPPHVQTALRLFGTHLGMAFQILDDCRDLLGDETDLGKKPGQDLLAGDVTLPFLYGIRCSPLDGGRSPTSGPRRIGPEELTSLITAFHSSQAPEKIRQLVGSHLDQARSHLAALRDSDSKESLHRLIDYIALFLSDILAR